MTLASCLDSTTASTWNPDQPEVRRDAGEEIVALATEAGDPELALKGHTWRQIAGLEESDVPVLDDALDAYQRCAEELGQPRYQWYALTRRTMRALLAGELDAGERLAREALAVGRHLGEGDTDLIFGCQMSLVWHERPDPEALGHLETTRAMFDQRPPREPVLIAVSRAHVTALAVGSGRNDLVRRELDRVGGIGIERVEPNMFWTSTVANVVCAVARVGNEDETVTLYDAILPYAGVNAFCGGAVSFWGSLSHHLGVLATRLALWDDAEAHLAQAEAVHERLGARVWLARTRLEQANPAGGPQPAAQPVRSGRLRLRPFRRSRPPRRGDVGGVRLGAGACGGLGRRTASRAQGGRGRRPWWC